MNGWIWQWYATEPLALNVCKNVACGFMCPLLGNSLLSGVTVWSIVIWFVHSTVSPVEIVTLAGLNAMLFMMTLWLSAIFSSLAGTCYIELAAANRKPTLNHTPSG
jgi:hypothetical protein